MARCDFLIIGIGNAGRGDDGLGWAFADRLAHLAPDHLQLEYRYQLVPEDAELLTHFSRVLFADASQASLPDGFALELCLPDTDAGLYTHQQTPGAILFLSSELYGHRPQAHLLTIQGCEWGFDTQLSALARQNLERAFAGFQNFYGMP